MIITHNREKLINAIIFFAKNTKYCGKTKLCKLLYFLDFEHFKETGRSVTGADYYAWKMGPVPVALYEEIESPEPDMAEKVRFHEKPAKKGLMLIVEPIAKFDSSNFSNRERRIMKDLAREYRNYQAEDIVEKTHLVNQPWYKTYIENQAHQQIIPYDLVISEQEKDNMREAIDDRTEFLDQFCNK